MNIVHLSDLHFSLSLEMEFKKTILDPLINDITKNISEIDFIVISGDLINKAGEDKCYIECFDSLKKHLYFLCEKLNIEPKKILFCPGNHDVNRKKILPEFEDIINKKTITLESLNSYIKNALTNESRKEIVFSRIEEYNTIRKCFIPPDDDSIDVYADELLICQKHTTKNGIVGIACFNTVWRCNGNENPGDLRLSTIQISKAEDFLKECDFRICLMHHNIEYMGEFERTFITNSLDKTYDLILMGHVHSSSLKCLSDIKGTTFYSIAPQLNPVNFLSDSKKHSNGYTLITLSDNQIICNNRRFSIDKNEFVANTDISDSGEDGIKIFKRNLSKNSKIDSEIKNALSIILDYSIETANSKLISYNGSTDAPSEINDIFVDPPITEDTSGEDGNPTIVNYTIKNIIEHNENYVLFGPKECGITTLLNKINIEILQTFLKKQTIPILIDLSKTEQFESANFDTFVSKYTGIKITSLRSRPNDFNFILLIDNMKFDIENKKIKKISSFCIKYSNTKIICATNTTLSGTIPAEFYIKTSLPELKPLTISYFKTKQIRELTSKWFSTTQNEINEKKLDKIINLCHTTDICSSPLSISMLLWIFEKDSSYKPLNYANVVENYIEKLLGKQDESEIYQNKFDFKNQTSVLSKIAYEMNINYTNKAAPYEFVTYEYLISIISKYLTTTCAPIDPKILLDYFISCGIFKSQIFNNRELYTFRFPCFYHYFIAKRIEQDEIFKKLIIKDLNYLDYVTEIDLYTSINRTDTTIIASLIQKLDAIYSDINTLVSNISSGIDEILEIEQSLAMNLKDDFLTDLKKSKKLLPEKTQHEIDELRDTILEKIEKRDLPRQNTLFTNESLKEFEVTWVLALRVIKNLENIDLEWYREHCFVKVLRCSVLFFIIYRTLVLEKASQDNDISEFKLELIKIILKFMPVILQSSISQIANSSNISTLSEKIMCQIEEYGNISELDSYELSQMEIFIIFNLISDNNLPIAINHYPKYHNNITYNYIIDNELVKLIMRYHEIPTSDTMMNNKILDILAHFKTNISKNTITNNHFNSKLKKTNYASRISKGNLISQTKEILKQQKISITENKK